MAKPDCLDHSTFRITEGISVVSRSNVYQVMKILRHRTFADIAECLNVKTGEILAIKFVKNKFYSQNKREEQIFKQLKHLNLHKNNIVKFSECFSYKDRTCFAYEKLDSTFLEMVLVANGKRVHLTEIRAIAYQMLNALTALNSSGFTHANIKPDNIMSVGGISHQYGVKLIGFSNSAKTSNLCDLKIPLACGYTAPEVYLDCPLDESLDIWSLGCTLAFLFLGHHLSPVDCEYQYMRFIVDVLGQPEKDLLDKGCQSNQFFKQVRQGSEYVWQLRSPKEFEEITGSEVKKTACSNVTDLNDLLFEPNQPEPVNYDDTEAFLDFLKQMLNVDPSRRIKPVDALNHPFMTMKHLRFISDKFYLRESQRIMEECHGEQRNVYSSLSSFSDRENTPNLDLSNEDEKNELACCTKLHSEELMRKYLKECNRGKQTGKNTFEVKETKGARSKETRECTKVIAEVSCKEEIKNSSPLIQTVTDKAPTRTVKSNINTTSSKCSRECDKKNKPVYSEEVKIRNQIKTTYDLFSDENCEEATSSKKLSEKKMDVDNLPLDTSTEWETYSSDIEEIKSTDGESLSLKIMPGMTITENEKVYVVEEVLGSGSFGVVARCRILETNNVVALKIMSGNNESKFFNEVQILQLLNNLTHFKHCFIRLNDSFISQGFLFQEFELLDESLLNYLRNRGVPLKVAEVRAIAQQMLEALSALKHLGITHADVKPDNIMLVNHKAQPFKVKLIHFGLACETERLPQGSILQQLAYRAPEITLGLPRDEALDTWSLGYVLCYLFLDCYLFPYHNEYDNLRIIMKLLGQPDKNLLDKGTLVSDYFIKVKKGSEHSWRFKTLEQYQKKKGEVSMRADPGYDDLTSLDDLFFSENTSNSTENEDIKVFLDFVKRLLTVDPANRILPVDALKHPFITMEHLDGASDKRYVRYARKIMKNVQPENIPSDGESEITNSSGPSQVPSVHTDLDQVTGKNTIDAKGKKVTFLKGTRECTKQTAAVSGKIQTSERKNMPHPDPRIPTNDEGFNELLSGDKCEGATFGKRSLEKTKTVKTETLDVDNLPPDTSSEWETYSSDIEEISSTDSDSSFIDIEPGMVIKGTKNDYTVEKLLGSGTYGTVVSCRIAGTMKMVALKIMTMNNKSYFLRENKIFEHLNQQTQYNKYFIRMNDAFMLEDFLCQEFELLDKDLHDFCEDRSLKVAEVRAIAKQMLEALGDLKHLGITHTDVKTDNIMLVNHKAQPFRVKLIDFGLACKTEHLPQDDICQNIAFRAPEMILGLPRDEALDTWSLGCVLSYLFLDGYLFPYDNEYDNLRIIMKFLGQPDKNLLDNGTLVSDYFIKVKKGSERSWRFKTLEQYQKKKGEVPFRANPGYDDVPSLEDWFFSRNTSNSTENEDIKMFLDFVKKLLTVDPANRIVPADALKHPFITMEHLDGASDKRYVRYARKIMKNAQPENFSSDGESEITNSSGPSQVPSVHADLDRFSAKVKTDESRTNFDSEEFVTYVKEQKGIKKAVAKWKTGITNIRKFFFKKYNSVKCYLQHLT